MSAAFRDRVVLLDDHDRPVGHADRSRVHGRDTPRHLAFSCHLFDDRGRVLLTRRSLAKAAWPGVWTNACCGHPRPGEDGEAAVRRRVREELGVGVERLALALPDFGYRATDASGIVENEACPVWVGRLSGTLAPDPAEVSESSWVAWPDLVAAARALPVLLSPWAALQVPLLDELLREGGAA
jgi:isopentenyl-diphosphate delta-isomerase type 1